MSQYTVAVDGTDKATFEFESEAQSHALDIVDQLTAEGYKFSKSVHQGADHIRSYRKGMADKVTVVVRTDSQ